MLPLAFALFFFSGVFALIYEVAWVRACSLHFGSTTVAIATVVALFMAGLALGAGLAGAFAKRIRTPLLAYGILEAILGLFALVSLKVIELCSALFLKLGPAVIDDFNVITALRIGLVGAALLIPTICMGATLPILTLLVSARSETPGRHTGLLYAVNTVGACFGCALCGCALLPAFGLAQTVKATAFVNLAAAVLAIACRGAAADPARGSTPESAQSVPRRLQAFAFICGLAALICEVAWTRVSVLLIGGSIYAFSIVLTIFLAGLGVGGYIASLFPFRSPERSRVFLGSIAVAAAAAIALSTRTFPHLGELFIYLFDPNDKNYETYFRNQVAVVSVILLLPSILLGAILPCALRLVVTHADSSARNVARLYTWNTAGSILGSLVCGLILIPVVGLQTALWIAQLLLCAAAFIAFEGFASGAGKRSATTARAGALCLFAASLFAITPRWDQQLMTSGVANYVSSFKNQGVTSLKTYLSNQEELLFYRDGVTATVTVLRDKQSPNHDLYISTNGKIDGSSHFDMPTQRLLAHFPLLLHPAPKRVCVIGLGTGTSAGSAALYPVDRVDVAEIERAMVEGARFFKNENHSVHDNPKVTIRVTDGRFHVAVMPNMYDVIMSEPSNPWLAGAADLFTVDFFAQASTSLRPGGIFAQWIHMYNLQPESLRIAVRSFQQVFPYVFIGITVPATDIVLLGTSQPLKLNAAQIAERMQIPAIADDLSDPRVNVQTPAQLLSRIWLSPQDVQRLAGVGLLHTDNQPVLAYEAARSLFDQTRQENVQLLLKYARGAQNWLDLNGVPQAEQQRLADDIAAESLKLAPQGTKELWRH